jgi:hypothetical protein
VSHWCQVRRGIYLTSVISLIVLYQPNLEASLSISQRAFADQIILGFVSWVALTHLCSQALATG